MRIEANDNEPYLRGCQAFEAGMQRHENPYEDDYYGTTFWEAWFDGWDDANDANLSQIESPR